MKELLVWFRRDLRLRDNPVLAWARAHEHRVVAIYIHAPQDEAPWAPGAASRWWLYHSLKHLKQALAAKGIDLYFFQGAAQSVLADIVSSTRLDAIAWNDVHEPRLHQRDWEVESSLKERGVDVLRFDQEHLLRPATLLNQKGQPYRVFTPFWKQLRARLAVQTPTMPNDTGTPEASSIHLPGGVELQTLGLLDATSWHEKLHSHWRPGESAARERMNYFSDSIMHAYSDGRDRPDRDETSRLSPHLHFGEITTPRLFAMLQPLLSGPAQIANAAESYLRQLAWREFAKYVLWHFPHTDRTSMDARYEVNFWQTNEKFLAQWSQGRTGVAIIDAGMRQLWQTGWMHNRVRMLVASFLTKNLGVAWQAGARWFWETLVDADLANNSMAWQWVAGCGVDAAPYFRIFNPLTQAEKFDPDGRYRDRWLDGSESRRLLDPIVDVRASRESALARYKTVAKRRKK